MITKLRLRNWKSHLDSELDFSPGVNALVGIVGSGKSSIMQAISFALFGNLHAVQSRKVSLQDIIMKRPQPKKEAEVELEFKANGKTYIVKRSLKLGKGTSEAEIREDGKLLDVNARNVTRIVEQALQMDYELFSKAVYSEQNELDYFLRIQRGKRTEHIDRMLKVDRFEQAREGAVAIRNRLMVGREEKTRIVADLEKEGLEDRFREEEKKIADIKNGLEKLRLQSKDVIKERARLQNTLEEQESMQTELHDLIAILEGVKASLEEMENTLSEKKEKARNPEEVRKDMTRLDSNIQVLKRQLDDKREEMDGGREQVASLNAKIKIAVENQEKLDGLGAKCPVCDNQIDGKKKQDLIDNRNEEEAKLREQVSSVVKNLDKIKKGREELEERLREKELERERVKARLEDAEELKLLSKRREEYKKRKESLERKREILQKGFSEDKLKRARESVQAKRVEETEMFTRMDSLKEKIEEKGEILHSLKERLKRLVAYRDEIKSDEDVAKGLESFVQALKSTQEQLRSEFVRTVNSIMDRVWGEIYPYGDYESIRLSVENDYVLQLKSSDGWVPVEGVASGGERSMACLALRIAFSHAFIPNLRWLILDEPTHNLDSASIEHLSMTLKDRIGAFAEQVFLITHEEKICDSLDSFYRLERDKSKNEPTRVVAM
ncbi:MAG: hypothetical protein V3V26_01090 [Candidatus Aenigmarchaeota archaeon]